MFDVNHCYWVVDGQGHINLANAPSPRAPLCVSVGIQAEPGPPTRLTARQALTLQQAAADCNQTSLTFLHSNEGITLIRRMLTGEHTWH
ncbi:MAG: hypothetical protein AAF460_16090 [Pseudomonadota bacterium]